MSGRAWRVTALSIFLVSVLLAPRLIGPAVPNEIRFLAGPEGTTFFEDGLKYQEILGRHGVDVHLVSTSGTTENLQGIRDAEEPTAALVMGIRDSTIERSQAVTEVESLGAMYLQPFWVFARRDADVETLRDLSGMRVEAGEEGSDSRLLALFLFEEEGLMQEVRLGDEDPLTHEELRHAVENDKVGAIVAVGEPDSRLIDGLLRSPRLQVVTAKRADAFALKFPALKAVTFPEGGHDIPANIPDRDLNLLAARTQLVVSDSFPPAVADLLLQAATEIHGGVTAFSARGEFPNADTAPLRLSRAAENFYANGPPKLQKYLPFRLATWINRFFMAGVATASAAVTIFNILPALLSLPFKRRLKHGYAELQAIERSAAAGTDKKTLLAELAAADRSTAGIKPPLHSLDVQWLELRQYLHDMRDRLE